MKLSVCIDAVYQDKKISDALAEVGNIGIKGFEFWSWWDKDIGRICATKDALGLEVVAICTRFISLVDAAQRNAYLAGLRETMAVCHQLGCTRIISQVGDDLGISRASQQKSLIEGLKASGPILESAGITLVFEPLNVLVDHAGYYLTSSAEAFEIVDAVGSPNVKVVFDIYHQQITEGHIIRNITANIDKIGHFHAAGNPGRHELNIGELNYNEIFRAIDASGYDGYMGLEYFPIKAPIEGLKLLTGRM